MATGTSCEVPDRVRPDSMTWPSRLRSRPNAARLRPGRRHRAARPQTVVRAVVRRRCLGQGSELRFPILAEFERHCTPVFAPPKSKNRRPVPGYFPISLGNSLEWMKAQSTRGLGELGSLTGITVSRPMTQFVGWLWPPLCQCTTARRRVAV